VGKIPQHLRKFPLINFFKQKLKPKTPSLMTTLAIRKIIAAESTLVVMTGCAAFPSGRKMHRSYRGGNLPAAPSPRQNSVATSAIQSLSSAVFCVTKIDRKCLCPI
jgi:hypothetical protein